MIIDDKIKPLVLPWPDTKNLSPNSRIHWAQKAKAKAKARKDACLIAKSAGWHRVEWPEGRLAVWIDYYAPDRRHRDIDNLLASSKAMLDGVADAMGVDDRHFVPYPMLQDEIKKLGEVVVKITKLPPRP